MKRAALSALLLVLLSSAVLLQAANGTFATPAKDLLAQAAAAKNEQSGDVVILLDERTYEIDAQSRINSFIHRIYRVDTQDGVEDWASVSASWSPWYEERPIIHARVITSDGAEHPLEPKALTEGPENEEEPNVYEDGKVLHGPLPAVTIGSVVEVEYVLKDREPMFAAGVAHEVPFGSHSGPVEKSIVVVRAPRSLPLKYVSRLLPNLVTARNEDGGQVEYRFEQSRLETLENPDPGLPSDVPRDPYVYFSTGESWKAIAAAYNEVAESKIRIADVDGSVKAAVKPGQSREETIRLLYNLLHKKARYTGVEFGDASLMPAFPAETIKRGYGDCKDKALLLVTMLRAAGIASHLALLDAGNDEDVEADLPAMSFNHAIVFVPGTPDLWVDATANDYRLGTTPEGDAGRLALIIRKETDQLVRIPETQPKDNVVVENREFFLAESGPAARVVENSTPSGIAEAEYRNYYDATDSKKAHEGFEEYVKNSYVAEKLGSVSHSDASDLTKPYELHVEALKCRRGYTNDESAEVAIPSGDIYDRLPQYLKGEDKETKADAKTQQPKKPRTTDYVFTPFITEWHYRIMPPAGYRVRALPENKTESLGPATLTYAFSTDKDGALLAKLTFDTVKGRYTPSEADAMRKDILLFDKRDALMVGFDNIGHTLLNEGKIPEALRQYESIAAQHPKEALHRTQVADAFLEVGFCETARKEARRATELEPKSAKAFNALAWVLEHDLICRRFKGAFDYDGAVAAYRKSIELDPSDVYTHVNLAILLEHGSDGVQYSETSHLDDAIAEHHQIRKMDKEVAQQYTDNLLYDLMYASQFKELQDELDKLSLDANRRAMTLVATTAMSSPAAAIEQSLRLTQKDADRGAALVEAARFMLRMRRYSDAAELMTAGAKGQVESAALLQQADIYRKTKRIEVGSIPDSDPKSVIFKILQSGFKEERPDEIVALMSASATEGQSRQEMIDGMEKDQSLGKLRAMIAKTGVPIDVICDIAFSNMQSSLEGDDTTGYRAVIQAIGAPNQTMFLTKDNGKFRLLDGKGEVNNLGLVVLELLQAKNYDGAKRVLDWARAEVKVSSGDDPLQGSAFPHLWTRGDDPDPVRMKNAALSMVAARKDAKRWIPEIIAARDAAKTDSDRIYLEDALMDAYVKSENWEGVRDSVLRQMKVYPKSNAMLGALNAACGALKDWDTLSKAIEARLASVPDDPDVLRQKVRLFELQSKFAEASAILKKLIDSGVGTEHDMNQYAWNALVMQKVTPDAIEQARRGVSIEKSYAVVHTLASLYAETGNSQEARQLLLGIMDDYAMNKPDGGLWYVFGRIAENYQQPDAAAACYKRVEWKEKFAPTPTTTYALAQQRLAGLGTPNGVVEAK